MSMLQHIADPVLQERYVRESVERISEVLFRVANSRDLTGLSLEVDLQGGPVDPSRSGTRARRNEKSELGAQGQR